MLKRSPVEGFSLLEVLIAILITAFGLLGLAGLMARMQVSGTESYGRSQAVALVWDMSERLYAALPTTAATANAYTNAGTTVTVGTGVTGYTSPCTGTGASRDLCEWHFALLGASETSGGSCTVATSQNCRGSVIGARGCITLLNAPATTAGGATPVCSPYTFRVTVAWQGLVDSADQSVTSNTNSCGANLYGNEKRRRLVSQEVSVGIPGCTTD
jgi:type IV pilus assembly protein PilV